MAATFDTPVLVTEVSDGRFRIFRGAGPPPGVPIKVPTSLHGFYQITGPLEDYYRLSPPESDVSSEEVLSWLENARRLGCEVKASHFAVESLRR